MCGCKLKIALMLIVSLACISCAKKLSVERGMSSIQLIDRVYFDTADAKVGKDQNYIIENNAKWMMKNPNDFLILEGHCDGRGRSDYNFYLGDRRAREVKAAMVESGIMPWRMAIVSFGETRPFARGYGEKFWKQNRRVKFVIR